MTQRIRTLATVAAFGVMTAAVAVASGEQTKPASAADTVNVTIKYSGKGTVDADHRLWVWLFTSPDISVGSEPIAEQSLQKNGGTVTFTNISEKAVYIAVAYDEKGGFSGSAPPPPGSPIAMYGVKTPQDKPARVVPGAKGSVTVTVSDAQRMQ